MEAEAPILWPPDAKSQITGKDPDAGKDWGQEEKRATEDKMVGWYHWLNGHESEQTLGDSEGQRNLACYSPWDHKESEKMTEQQHVQNIFCNLLRKDNSQPVLSVKTSLKWSYNLSNRANFSTRSSSSSAQSPLHYQKPANCSSFFYKRRKKDELSGQRKCFNILVYLTW